MFYKFRSIDWQILITPLILAIIGLISIYSITAGSDLFYLFKKQALFIILGFALYIFISLYKQIDYEKLAIYLYIISIVILVLVLFRGANIHGTKAWINIGGLRLEPLEIAKIFLVMTTASLISKYGHIRKKHSTIASGLLMFIPIFLIIRGQEFGTVAILGSTWLILILLYNFNYKYIIISIIISIILIAITWFFILNDNQKSRITSFRNPEIVKNDEGYQAFQAKVAIGSGKWFGRGLGYGRQSQLRYLPETHTDFIFALIAEEWGFVGVCVLLLILFNFLGRIFWISSIYSFTTFQSLTITGIGLLLTIQSFINIGMNLNLLPIAGVPLPFVSYGGSSLLSSFIALGIIQNFICQNKEKAKLI